MATPSLTDMSSDTPQPETIRPPNGNKDNNPVTPFQCQLLQETLLVQSKSFIDLKDSIDKLTVETKAQSHEFASLHDAIENLTHEMKLFRESLVNILARLANTVLAEHQKQQGQET